MSGQCVQPTTFEAILAAGEPLPLTRALALVRQAALALDRLHLHQQVHGAIAPEAFQLDGEDRVRLLPPPEQPACNDADPARAYWSPQRRAGEPARPADDRFALGLVAYELLTGRCPPPGWPAADAELAAPSSAALPPAIAAVLRAQCAWAPSERIASGAELVRELDRAARQAAQGSRADTAAVIREGGAQLAHEADGPPAHQAGQQPEPAWAAARRVAEARRAQRLALAALPDRSPREERPARAAAPRLVMRREYPDLPLAGGWVAAIAIVLCSVYLFPIFFMLFPRG